MSRRVIYSPPNPVHNLYIELNEALCGVQSVASKGFCLNSHLFSPTVQTTIYTNNPILPFVSSSMSNYPTNQTPYTQTPYTQTSSNCLPKTPRLVYPPVQSFSVRREHSGFFSNADLIEACNVGNVQAAASSQTHLQWSYQDTSTHPRSGNSPGGNASNDCGDADSGTEVLALSEYASIEEGESSAS